jgi:integrase
MSNRNQLILLKNHIIPYIGDLDIQKVTPRDIEKLYDTLRSKKISGIRSQGADDTRCLSSTSIRHVHTVLKLAFAKAVEWKLLQASPVVCKAPKKNRNPDRPIWDADTVRLALGSIEDPILRLAVHLAFVCSLRNGETMALTWDCIDFDKKRILVSKTLQRIYKDVMAKLPKDNICFVFPPKIEDSKSVLVLKSPKTETSSRYIYITEQLKHELQQRKQQVEEDKEYWGSAYEDFGLVLCLADGYPIEPKLLEKWFKKWQEKTNHAFPKLVFHGLRHSVQHTSSC